MELYLKLVLEKMVRVYAYCQMVNKIDSVPTCLELESSYLLPWKKYFSTLSLVKYLLWNFGLRQVGRPPSLHSCSKLSHSSQIKSLRKMKFWQKMCRHSVIIFTHTKKLTESPYVPFRLDVYTRLQFQNTTANDDCT